MISSTHGVYRRRLWLLAGLMVFIQSGLAGMLGQGGQSAAAGNSRPDAAIPQDTNDEYVYHFPVFMHTGSEPGEFSHFLYLPAVLRQSDPSLAQTEAATSVVSRQPHPLCCTVNTDSFVEPLSQAPERPDCSLCEIVKTDLYVRSLSQAANIELALYNAPFPHSKSRI
jgi:hypothetical protein